MSSNAVKVNFETVQNVHFIGVGGIGMSSLARHCLFEKKTVSGSDRTLTDLTKKLAAEGVQVMTPQSADNITSALELVIYTEAVTEGSEGWSELEAARSLGIPTMNYFAALGLAMNPYYLIAVAGTHGKTTTTAMLTDVFEATEKDPTAVIGSLRAITGTNYRGGKSKYAIVEACEYKDDFLSLKPEILIITNLEHEHVDHYPDLQAVQTTFKKLVAQVAEDGVVVTNPADEHIAPVLKGASCRIVDYMQYIDVQASMTQPGFHNRLNAAAAVAAAVQEGIDQAEAQNAVAAFRGTWRRFEFKGEVNGAPVYDDYAHHPTEISVTIAAARELYPDREVVVAFQPHTYSRTAALFDDFAGAIAQADRALVLPIYAAREENMWGVSSRELAVKALERNQNVEYTETMESAEQRIRTLCTDQSVVLVVGAGTIPELAKRLIEE